MQNSKKNILVFNLKTDASDDILGFTTDWLNALAEKFQKVYVITMYKGKVETADNVEVYSVGKEKGYSEIRRIYEFYRLFFQILRKNNINLVFAHMVPEFAILAGVFTRIKKIPLILWHAHKKVSWRLRLAALLVDWIFTPSADSCRLKNRKKIVITGHGINLDKFKNLKRTKNKQIKFITVSRISPIKNIDQMILFFKNILIKNSNSLLKIIGNPLNNKDKTYYNKLKKLISANNLQQCIGLKKAVPYKQIEKEYVQADYFLNFSSTGSIDKTVIEALAAGCIPITTNEAFRAYSFYYDLNELLKVNFKLPQRLDRRTVNKILASNSLAKIVVRLTGFQK